ncbi:putative glycosyltransferase EpsD [Tritonibacter horizontis]|uniref:Putative glycosyltransferase EpsD n=2 Tax=Tritonibacter horizontis TaxID=1768241 RepID=A0A132BZP4_9RHOB|nr:putative glycosyltransferase EpsD [Tritonibacter horizontis]
MERMLKIALILETSGGGSGRHVLDLAQGLSERGHAVTVIWSPLRADDGFRDRLFEMNRVRNVTVDLHRSVGLHDLKGFRDLAKVLKNSGPFDILHAHSSKAGALTRLLPKRGPVRIYTPHALRTMDPAISRLGYTIYGTIERMLALRGDPVIAVSQKERAHAVQLGLSPQQVSCIPNGASPVEGANRDRARAEMGLAPTDFAVGFVGRMVDQKNPQLFVEALRAATHHAPNIKGVMMGDGPLMEEVRTLAKDLPIELLGWCDAPSLIYGLDTLCITSRYEALAYSFLEALQAHVPLVTTPVGGAEETVQDGKTGYVLPQDPTPDALAAPLVSLATDPDRHRAFQEATAVLARERSIEKMVDATIALYQTSLTDFAVLPSHKAGQASG